jgi:hypothetical protein
MNSDCKNVLCNIGNVMELSEKTEKTREKSSKKRWRHINQRRHYTSAGQNTSSLKYRESHSKPEIGNTLLFIFLLIIRRRYIETDSDLMCEI